MSGNEETRQLIRDFKGFLEFQGRMGNGRVMPAETVRTERSTARGQTVKSPSAAVETPAAVEATARAQSPARSGDRAGAQTVKESGDTQPQPVEPPPVVIESDLFAAGGTLQEIREDLGDCSRCKLHSTRKTIVFGEGNPDADIVFVGEGPGRDEDEQGRPFVGRAGQLLDKIIAAMEMKRSDVYICNVVKCRPPDNRNPEPDEVAECEPFLIRQINSAKPRVVVCLGLVAAKALLKIEGTRSLGSLRGVFHTYGNSKLMVTYHPAALLRNPAFKRPLWEDMKTVMAEIKK